MMKQASQQPVVHSQGRAQAKEAWMEMEDISTWPMAKVWPILRGCGSPQAAEAREAALKLTAQIPRRHRGCGRRFVV